MSRRRTRPQPYPLNLWSEVFEKAMKKEDLPADWEKTLAYLLSRLGNKNKGEFLLLYFRDGQTMSQIGRSFNLSRICIGTHIDETLECLRRPPHRYYMEQGYQESVIMREKHIGSFNALALPISELNLTIGTKWFLSQGGIETVGQLIGFTQRDLMKMCGIGIKAIEGIRECLAMLGYSLAEAKPQAQSNRSSMLYNIKTRKNS